MSKKPKKNEPCPCGSGKKYKKCCLGGDRLDALKTQKANLPEGRLSGKNERSEEVNEAKEVKRGKEMKGVDEGAGLPNPDIYDGASGKLSKTVNGRALHDSVDWKIKDMEKDELLKLRYDRSVIESRTKRIYHRMLEESEYLDQGNFTCIAPADLKRLFELYDEYFFHNFFNKHYQGQIHFQLSKRMTRVGGKILTYRNREDIDQITNLTLAN